MYRFFLKPLQKIVDNTAIAKLQRFWSNTSSAVLINELNHLKQFSDVKDRANALCKEIGDDGLSRDKAKEISREVKSFNQSHANIYSLSYQEIVKQAAGNIKKYYDVTDFRHAMEIIDRTLELPQDSLNSESKRHLSLVYTYKASIIRCMARYKEAFDCFDKALELWPDNRLADMGKQMLELSTGIKPSYADYEEGQESPGAKLK